MDSKQLAWLIRRHGVEMTHLSHGSHIGAILSVADIMAVLYADILQYTPKEPGWDGRDIRGAACQQGAYAYICEYRLAGNVAKRYLGTVLLLR